MRKKILVSVLFAIIALSLLSIFIFECWNLSEVIKANSMMPEEYVHINDSALIYSIAYLVVSLIGLIATVVLFVYRNPRLFRRSTECAQNKSERAAAKQAKAESEKQKEIAELQARLDELKKDE